METNSNKNLIIGIVIAIIVIVGGYFMFSKNQPSALTNTNEPIKIGFIGPLTGDVSSIGQMVQKTVQLAVKEVNDAGGINGRKIEVVYEDGKCSPADASNAANKLINVDKVSAIVGGTCSSETAAFAPAAMQNKVVVISNCSSAPNLSNTGKYFFRDYPSDALQGKFAAEFAYNVLGKRKAAILYHITDWGTGLKDMFSARFKELGGEITVVEGAAQKDREYKTQLTKIKNSGSDLLYMPVYSEGGIIATKQFKDLGLKMQILGGDVFDDTNVKTEISKILNNSVTYIVPAARPMPEFEQKLKTAYGNSAEITACVPQAYDAVKILSQVMKKVGIDSDSIQTELHNLKDYQGVSGIISFDQNGDITLSSYVAKVIKDGSSAEYVK